jgi:hypothetical protein
MRFKKIFLVLALAMFMLAGVAWADDDDDDDDERIIRQLQADVAALQAQIAALTGEVDSVQAQTNQVATDLSNFKCFCPYVNVPYDQIDANTANTTANAVAIASNTSNIASNKSDIYDLQTDTQECIELADYIKVDTGEHAVYFKGANVYVVNGMGATNTTNGLGNLIVGYNSVPAGELNLVRDGSHNVIIGDGYEYREYSELGTTSIVATPSPLNIISVGDIDLWAGLDVNLNAGANVLLDAGNDAFFRIAKSLNFAAQDLNLDMTNLNLDVINYANILVGTDLNLDIGEHFIFVGNKLDFDLATYFNVTTGSSISLRTDGDFITKGRMIQEY